MTTNAEEENDENAIRRAEELEALESFYGPDSITTKSCNTTTSTVIWNISIQSQITLSLHIPSTYPSLCTTPPKITIGVESRGKDNKVTSISQTRRDEIINDMMDLYEPEMEVAIVWAEHCRAALEEYFEEDGDGDDNNDYDSNNNNNNNNYEEEDDAKTNTNDNNEVEKEEGVQTFIPPTSKFNQPIRNFPTSIIEDNSNHRSIYKGPPFYPPKGGQGETMIAHVASVTCYEHVQYVLATLLFHDKKVAKATHNMFAYTFIKEDGTKVSDNDDDGEKGSGSKLAALLDMTKVENVIVIVSRWYGGIHLGSARFKWIATVARDALEEAGYITSSGGSGSAAADASLDSNEEKNGIVKGGGKRKGRKH